jgi:phosphonatase-like hydrolase
MIELAVIDLAGTLVRDDGAVEGAFLDALRTVDEIDGGAPDVALLEAIRGTMGRSKIAVFRELLGEEERALAANAAFEAAYARRIAGGETTALPTAHAALRELCDAGVLVAVTTGFSAQTRDALLVSLDWADLVDLALSPTPELRGRPAPDLVLAAVLRLGIEDVRLVAVAGDTTNDLQSGQRAGAGIVAWILGGAHTRAELERAPHTHILESVGAFAALVVATRRGSRDGVADGMAVATTSGVGRLDG